MNLKPLKLFVIVLTSLLMPSYVSADIIVRELQNLDKVLADADAYTGQRLAKIEQLEKLLQQPNISLEYKYDIYRQLYQEYEVFQFNKALEMLNHRLDIAVAMKDETKRIDTELDKAQLYTISGVFTEVDKIFTSKIDTLALSPSQLTNYYFTQQHYYRNLEWKTGYARSEQERQMGSQRWLYYCNKLMDSDQTSTEVHQYISMLYHMRTNAWQKAEEMNEMLIAHCSQDSHAYAEYAYFRASIYESWGKTNNALLWYIRSAIADVKSATKDTASIRVLSEKLLPEDINRAFHYINIALENVIFYNGRLRHEDITEILPLIEDEYMLAQEEQRTQSHKLFTIISILAVALAIICMVVIYMYYRSVIARHEIASINKRINEYNDSLSEINLQLKETNNALGEANEVKEEYIGLFLAMCSNYIDKLKSYQRNIKRKLAAGKYNEILTEVSSTEYIDTELKSFYEMFDKAFLQLYPNFVEEFNELLKPDKRIILNKDERMNTELRIFALIRLGITESSRIAALLRYSANTIYNYRARVKNCALDSREEFEEKIKTIGARK
jgi:DNA-binding CsgD family transcriptional regulator